MLAAGKVRDNIFHPPRMLTTRATGKRYRSNKFGLLSLAETQGSEGRAQSHDMITTHCF